MKRATLLVLLFASLVVISSCKKEDDTNKDYFREPLTDWTLKKVDVRSSEKRPLKDDYGPESIVLLGYPFTDKGSGYMEYYGEIAQLERVTYGFFCTAETLVQAYCEFVNNSGVETDLRAYMIKKYGDLYDEQISGNDKKLTWTKPGMLIIMSRTNYGLSVIYRKNPL